MGNIGVYILHELVSQKTALLVESVHKTCFSLS